MTERKSRRTVFAELLLLANPTEIRQAGDGQSLRVEFESIADLRSWLHAAGLNSDDLTTHEFTEVKDDGTPYRTLYAWPKWHGWKISAYATDRTDPGPLDTDTVDKLAALTGA
ncbi:hypothetical protein [Polymorphospora lycopeni]|uniref:Uncharacterized protein n=1 Tax=Polymorphospora lycopeni TaxID=3140240 RepID=A0ABV5D4X7_9ACTN